MRKPISIERARDEELDRALRRLRRGEEPARVLDEFSRRLTNKLMHAPTKALRDVTEQGPAFANLLTPNLVCRGAEVVTLEGLGTAEKPHPLQKAVIDEQAVRCATGGDGRLLRLLPDGARFVTQYRHPVPPGSG
jgi:hypothetical protein